MSNFTEAEKKERWTRRMHLYARANAVSREMEGRGWHVGRDTVLLGRDERHCSGLVGVRMGFWRMDGEKRQETARQVTLSDINNQPTRVEDIPPPTTPQEELDDDELPF